MVSSQLQLAHGPVARAAGQNSPGPFSYRVHRQLTVSWVSTHILLQQKYRWTTSTCQYQRAYESLAAGTGCHPSLLAVVRRELLWSRAWLRGSKGLQADHTVWSMWLTEMLFQKTIPQDAMNEKQWNTMRHLYKSLTTSLHSYPNITMKTDIWLQVSVIVMCYSVLDPGEDPGMDRIVTPQKICTCSNP